jgi:hypothetical protein
MCIKRAYAPQREDPVMSELAYLGSILLTLGAYAVAGWALWQLIEGGFWVYCKITGKEY